MRKIAVKVASYIFIFCFMLAAAGCTGQKEANSSPDDKRISVYTSFYTLYDFTKKIGGDKINLKNLVPAGTEPHDWEPSPKDIANLEKANVLVYNGAGMEHWVDKVTASIKNNKLIAVETAKDIKLVEGAHDHDTMDHGSDKKESKHEEEGVHDPHVWLNPMLAKKQMEAIKNALVAADPTNKDYYEGNFSECSKKLDELDKEYKNAVAKFKKKEIVVSHQAFSYLCDAYGLKQVAIEGLSADSEPTPSRMAEIIKFAKDNHVKVIFFEELVNPKVAQTIAKEVGAKTEVLNPLEGLKEEDIKAGKEYFTVMKANLEALKKALE